MNSFVLMTHLNIFMTQIGYICYPFHAYYIYFLSYYIFSFYIGLLTILYYVFLQLLNFMISNYFAFHSFASVSTFTFHDSQGILLLRFLNLLILLILVQQQFIILFWLNLQLCLIFILAMQVFLLSFLHPISLPFCLTYFSILILIIFQYWLLIISQLFYYFVYLLVIIFAFYLSCLHFKQFFIMQHLNSLLQFHLLNRLFILELCQSNFLSLCYHLLFTIKHRDQFIYHYRHQFYYFLFVLFTQQQPCFLAQHFLLKLQYFILQFHLMQQALSSFIFLFIFICFQFQHFQIQICCDLFCGYFCNLSHFVTSLSLGQQLQGKQ